MKFLARLWLWLFSSRLHRLEWHASKIGRLTLQQVDLADRIGWSASLRPNSGSGPRYAWTGTGDTLEEAIDAALANAGEYEIGSRPVMPHAPRLGGKEYDD